MAILVVGYSVEWTKDRTLASQFLAQVREVHEEANAPCTLYLLGEVILAHRKALESLAENPLFDLQITVSKPLKSVCQVVQGQTTVWRGATLEQIDEEVSRCRSLFNEHFGRPPQGISSPLGFYRGLQDRPDILEVLDRHGIRFCRTYARNEQDWQPVEFSVEPFWYTSQGFSHILEFPGQGWQEAIIRRIYGWDDTDGYLEYVKADANDVARREELVWSYWAHDWSVLQGTPDMSHISGLLRYAGEIGIEIMTQEQAYRVLLERERSSRAPKTRADADERGSP